MKMAIAVVAIVASMAMGSAVSHAQAPAGYETEPVFPLRQDIQAPEHVGFVSGRLSPLAQKEFTKRDWKLFESFPIAAER